MANGKLTGGDRRPDADARPVRLHLAQAAPILQGEAISAQSANIDSVSGATYTSQAYAQSLQSALDQAGI